MGKVTRFQFPVGSRDFSLLDNVRTGCRAHPALYPGAKNPGNKRGKSMKLTTHPDLVQRPKMVELLIYIHHSCAFMA
jgi:hypothetical protein